MVVLGFVISLLVARIQLLFIDEALWLACLSAEFRCCLSTRPTGWTLRTTTTVTVVMRKTRWTKRWVRDRVRMINRKSLRLNLHAFFGILSLILCLDRVWVCDAFQTIKYSVYLHDRVSLPFHCFRRFLETNSFSLVHGRYHGLCGWTLQSW